MPTRRPRRTLLLFVTTVVLTGCPSVEPFPELHPLTGTVSRDGKSVTAGGLIFLPDPPNGSGLVVNAHVKPDGTFAAETSRTKPGGGLDVKPGAPAGRYRVVYHPPSDGSKMGLDTELDQPVTVEAKPNTTALTLPTVMPKGD